MGRYLGPPLKPSRLEQLIYKVPRVTKKWQWSVRNTNRQTEPAVENRKIENSF